MEEERFSLLVQVLKLLEQEELKGVSLPKAIARVIDSFDADLTQEQRTLILREFAHYERTRREKEKQDSQRKEAIIEEEKYREALNKFLREEDRRFGF